jgi:glycosyltransferase involved in cell wall biosynthesis
LRHKFNVPINAFVILFTGKFYDVKRPFDLLKAYARAEVSEKYLVMVGDGVLKSEIEEFILKEGISSVVLPGFINQTEISEYYAISDVFVLCSESETWGLSVNEAMNFQLPIILNDSIGCHTDLLYPNKNGILVKKGDVNELAQAISKIGNDSNFRTAAGIESKMIIEKFTFGKIIEGFKTALNK